MTDTPSRSVLIVEDHRHTLDQLRSALMNTPDLHVCGIAETLSEGLSKLAMLRPDLVLTDLGLPDGSGIGIIRAARAAAWGCNSMVFSVFGDERRVIDAIRAGARGYILKTTPPEAIVKDIRDVMSGGSPISPKVARYLLAHLAVEDQQSEETEVQLTSRERDVLALVARGYKRSEVSTQLGISIGTVGNHIHNIYRKLEVSSNIEAVMLATRSGLI